MRHPYSSVRSFWAVFLRECHRMCSRPVYFYCIVVGPLICLFFFTALMNEGMPHDLPLGVVDMDGSSNSRNVVRTLDAMDQVAVRRVYTSYSEAREAVQRNEIYGFLYIPPRFSHDLQSARQPKLTYYVNYAYFVPGSLLYSSLRKVTELVSGAALRSQLYARGATEKQAMGFVQPIVIEAHATFNPSLNYNVYLTNTILPGVMMLLISLMTVYAVGSEVKFGTARYWLERGNHSVLLSLTAKLLPYTLSFLLIAFFCNFYLYVVLEIPCNSGFPATMLLSACMVLSAQALGLLFFALIPTMRMALSMCCLWGVVSFSICGFTFPKMAMPPAVQALTNLFPLRHYFLIYVSQTLDGNPIGYAAHSYIALLLFMLLPLLLLLRLKRELIHVNYIP